MTRSAACATVVRFAPDLSTGKERDAESGNDYFEARYYSSAMGRFMSPDPANLSVDFWLPQTWSRYEARRPYGAPAFMAWLSPGFPSPCSFAYAQGMATGPPGAILLLPLRGGRCARLPRPSSLASLAPVLSCSIHFRHNHKQEAGAGKNSRTRFTFTLLTQLPG